jgi:monooxygenase
MDETISHHDVIIVGAGLSGIGSAYRLQTACPERSYLLLEARDRVGGTWDLFRYPGIRSDSDMHTLGWSFRPWQQGEAIADGPSILTYIRETAEEYGIDKKIRFGHRVQRASWSSENAMWRLDILGPDGENLIMTCNFLSMCSGYYDYENGYMPGWPHMERYRGQIVHPQKWPEDLRYEAKRVIVIGSGATAVTLVPSMAEKAAHIVMLQRSPSYVVTRPSVDRIAGWLHRRLPYRLAHELVRWKNVLLQMYFYNLARRKPGRVKNAILDLARRQLDPGFDVGTHFSPRYDPWDQRVCVVPDGDLFHAIRAGQVSVVTDEIAHFTETGVMLRSGREIEADIIVTATGLKVQMLGGMHLIVDGVPTEIGRTVSYKGTMFSDIPNLALAFGYTNASWTLKSDLSARYVCRLLNHMRRHRYDYCVPRLDAGAVQAEATPPLTSGYVQRAKDILPRQGGKTPWKIHQNYVLDLMALRFGRLEDGTIEFARRVVPPAD